MIKDRVNFTFTYLGLRTAQTTVNATVQVREICRVGFLNM